MDSPVPPAHLLLGREGIDNVEKQLRSILQEIDLWRQTGVGADFGGSDAAQPIRSAHTPGVVPP